MMLINSQNITMIKNIKTTTQVHSVKYSPDGKYLAYTSTNNGLRILRTSNFSFVNSTTVDFIPSAIAYALAYSHDQTKIAYSIAKTPNSSIRIVLLPNS